MRRLSDPARPALSGASAPWANDFDTEQVVGVLEPLVGEARRRRILDALERRLVSVTLVMDALHDPHNGAAILRSADAFGLQEVHVVPRSEPFFASGSVAKGAERWVDVVVHPSPSHAVEALAARGFELVAAHPEGDLAPEDLAEIDKLALLVGNEHDGIRQELQRAARRSVRVPMRGFVESLNVSVSAALLLRAATWSRSGDLSPGDRRLLYARGLFRSVPRASEILRAARDRPRRL